MFAVAAWRETPFYTDAERAALSLAEEVTRISDRGETVPDHIWDEAAAHYEPKVLAALVPAISTINTWNRIAITTRMVPGSLRHQTG